MCMNGCPAPDFAEMLSLHSCLPQDNPLEAMPTEGNQPTTTTMMMMMPGKMGVYPSSSTSVPPNPSLSPIPDVLPMVW